VLHSAYVQLHPISLFCIDNFRNNAAVIDMPERVATAWEEKNLLHDLQENEEEDAPPTNPISSDDSYDAQILDEKSREDFDCLNEFTEVIHNDELELQSSKGESLASTENHEVFTHNDSHGKNLNLYMSLTLSL
jgi:hypothetical protein